MPSILLINDNKIVSRLLQLSSQKNGYNLEEVTTLDTSTDSYDVVFIDSDQYTATLFEEVSSKLNYDQLGYIGTRQDDLPEGFDLVIEKPFLPTDFVEMIKEKVINRKPQDEKIDLEEAFEEEMDEIDALSLESEDLELDDMDNDVEELLTADDDDLDTDGFDLENVDDLDDMDLSLDSASVMSTGIATSMMTQENNHEELADMVSEIDEMGEEPASEIEDDFTSETLETDPSQALESLEESLDEPLSEVDDVRNQEEASLETLDLEDLDDEVSIEEDPILSIEEEVESETSIQNVDDNEEVPLSGLELDSDDEELTIEGQDVVEDELSLDDEALTDTVEEVGEDDLLQGMSELTEESSEVQEIEELTEDSIDETLIESLESDVEETMDIDEPSIEEELLEVPSNQAQMSEVALMDDIDALSETEIQSALGEKVGDVVEEIISDEIMTDGEESVVEFGEMEQWIKDAVAKAITPEMIKEALDGMDVSVTLNFKNKKEDETTI
ncbi:MAG: hypothetical protein K0U47_10920 [Epsilonproteobacteria bacterium]|nr:hypothetical protein [Campylobacterota bacterium]